MSPGMPSACSDFVFGSSSCAEARAATKPVFRRPVRPERRLSRDQSAAGVHLHARLRGQPARVPPRVRGAPRVPPATRLPQEPLRGPLQGHVRHQRRVPRHQPQPDLQLPRRLHGRSFRPVHPLTDQSAHASARGEASHHVRHNHYAQAADRRHHPDHPGSDDYPDGGGA